MKYDIAFDFEKSDRCLTRGGNMKLVTGKQALLGRILKALYTAKGRFAVYAGTNYGNEIEVSLIGRALPSAYVASEIERIVKDCIGSIEDVNDVNSFAVKRDGALLEIEFTVDTPYGTQDISISI